MPDRLLREHQVGLRSLYRRVQDIRPDRQVFDCQPQPRSVRRWHRHPHLRGREHLGADEARLHGIHEWMSPKHLHCYVDEYCGRYNTRKESTLERVGAVFDHMRGKRLLYRNLVS